MVAEVWTMLTWVLGRYRDETCDYDVLCFFSSRSGHTRCSRDWSSDVCSSDLTDAQFRAVIDLIESAESAIAPTLMLVRFPRGRHPLTYSADGIGTPLRHVDDMSQVNEREIGRASCRERV